MASPLTAKSEPRNPALIILGQCMFAMRVFLLVAMIVIGVPLHFIWRIFTQNTPWPRTFLLYVGWVFGVRAQPVGNRIKSNVFYASNHHSWIDIPIISGITGCTFVAQDGIRSWPVIGFLCNINNTIFVSRENRLSVGDQIGDLRRAMTGDQPVTIFPEGTTHDGSGLLPFKPSLFAALVPPPPGMMVQPVYLTYGAGTARIAWTGNESALHNFWRVLSYFKPVPAKVYFLEPFDPAQYPDRKAISAEVRARILAAKERVDKD